MTHEDIQHLLADAVGKLVRQDAVLVNWDGNKRGTERSVAARLLHYLIDGISGATSLGEFDVDFEYERAGIEPKALWSTDSRLARPVKIVPDLIVHKRQDNTADSNLLAIEVKLTRSPQEPNRHDAAKLLLLTGIADGALYFPRTTRFPGGLRLEHQDAPPNRDRSEAIWVGPPSGVSPYRLGVALQVHADGATANWWQAGKSIQPTVQAIHAAEALA